MNKAVIAVIFFLIANSAFAAAAPVDDKSGNADSLLESRKVICRIECESAGSRSVELTVYDNPRGENTIPVEITGDK
ncbi:MAG: hypothetical protein C0623_02135 [Desulfuromonas sp.]|nr:MAG: hypothetical protein C0623_02135 [Desulfuromonas sp.]